MQFPLSNHRCQVRMTGFSKLRFASIDHTISTYPTVFFTNPSNPHNALFS